MKNVMEMFTSETQLIRAESAFDVAMTRIKTMFPKANEDSYHDKLWNNIALSVINDGYDAAMDYARNACFTV